MLLESLIRLQENEARLREILLVLGKYGLADWLGKLHVRWIRDRIVTANGQRIERLGRDERIRVALLELGTTFIKFGQVLSTRPDVVGAELATELSKLQCGTPAEPIDMVRQTIQVELGQPPERLFAEFDPEALASASIAQVHRARLHSGQAVVVKVQHAGIEARIRRDLDLLLGLAELVQKHVGPLRNYRPVSTVREFRRTLLRELDLTAERRSLEAFARNFAGDAGVHFPAVYPQLCARRVLTMELLDGVLGCDAPKLSAQPDVVRFVRRAATMYLDMIFRDGFYHADPHPGNYVILPGSVVGVLDCGMVGRLDEALREQIEAALIAISERDSADLAERIIQLGAPPADLNRPALTADVAEFVAEYGSRPIKELDLAAALSEMTDIIARYQIRLPANASLLLRTLIVLEGSARQLDPAFSLMEVIVDYRTRSARLWLSPSACARGAQRAARDYGKLLRIAPADLIDILHRFRAGTFELRHEHHHLQASVHRLVLAVLTASLLLSSAALLAAGSDPLSNVLRPALGLGMLVVSLLLGLRLLRSLRRAAHDPPEY